MQEKNIEPGMQKRPGRTPWNSLLYPFPIFLWIISMGSSERTTKTYFLTLWVDINEAVTLPANPKLINCRYIHLKLALLQFPWGDEAQVLVLAVPRVRTLHRCPLLPGSVLAKLCLGNLWMLYPEQCSHGWDSPVPSENKTQEQISSSISLPPSVQQTHTGLIYRCQVC